MSFIFNFFGSILRFFYSFCNSYGIALILFTILIKLLLLPLGIKQQKNTIKQIKLQPKEQLIRKKYSYDKNLSQQKVMEFYQKEGFNPMAGCLPLVVQLPVMLVLYRVIQRPLTYISQYSSTAIASIVEKLQSLSLSATETEMLSSYLSSPTYNEVELMRVMSSHSSQLGDLFNGLPNFNFLGLDLMAKPSISHFNLLLLIPLFAFVTSLLQTLVSQSTTKYISQNKQGGNSNLMMFVMGPVMSLFFTFSFNAGIGLYWGISNVVMILQTLLLNAIMSPKQAAADAHYELVAAVEERKRKKAAEAEARRARIEQDKLDKKNAARKAAGQRPLNSSDAEGQEETEQVDNGENESHD